MHRLLERQLRKQFGDLSAVPDDLRPFLRLVSDAYAAADQDRSMLERSMDLMSKELLDRNQELAAQVERERTAREALRRSEADFRRIIETSSEGIWVLGPDNKTTFVNQRMADLVGYTRDDLAAMTPLDVIVGDRRPEAQKAFQENSERMSGQRDVQMQRRDGSRIWAIVSSQAIRAEDGSYGGALGMVMDITARKGAEEGLKEAYEQLQDLEKARAEFINSAAHELSTPLTPLKLEIHMLAKKLAGDEGMRSRVDIIQRNVERLAHLVTDMLDSSRLQTGTLHINLEPHDLGVLARAAAHGFQGVAAGRGVHLAVDAGVPLPVRCDPGRIGQVLDNLLSNAFKFTPPGKQVRVTVALRDDRPTVTVQDQGVGISKSGLRRLFQPFSQVHELSPDIPRGTGLGLYISKGIIEQHGGHIWAASAGKGQGASFSFFLPKGD